MLGVNVEAEERDRSRGTARGGERGHQMHAPRPRRKIEARKGEGGVKCIHQDRGRRSKLSYRIVQGEEALGSCIETKKGRSRLEVATTSH